MRSGVQEATPARPLPGCNPPESRRTDGSSPSSSIRWRRRVCRRRRHRGSRGPEEGDLGRMGRGVGTLNWSPRGDELWFTAEGRTDTPGMAIRAVSLSGKERVVLTGPGVFGLRDLSRDGRLLMERGDPSQSRPFSAGKVSSESVTSRGRTSRASSPFPPTGKRSSSPPVSSEIAARVSEARTEGRSCVWATGSPSGFRPTESGSAREGRGLRSPDSASHRARGAQAAELPGLEGISRYSRQVVSRQPASRRLGQAGEGGATLLSRGSRRRRASPRDPRGNGSREGLRLLAQPGRKMGHDARRG